MPRKIKNNTSENKKGVKNNKDKKSFYCNLWSHCGWIKTNKLFWSLLLVVILLLTLILVYWFVWHTSSSNVISVGDENINVEVKDEPVGLSNPASVNCLDLGGNLEMKKHSNGGEYGICLFPNGFQCEEWAMFRGDCPVAGVDTSGYLNDWDYYCAVTGGQVLPGDNCKVSEDITCNSEDYYLGRCHK